MNMKRTLQILLFITLYGLLCVAPPTLRAQGLSWPAIERAETKPWTWWWWHGCAVSNEDISANLEALQKSGIGGVTIVCLLDVKDSESRKLGYLSPEWRDAVVHAVSEARRLGMDVDMSPVPGWAFGGPWVPLDESCAKVDVRQWSVTGQNENKLTPLTDKDLRNLDALVVITAGGQVIDLTKEVRASGLNYLTTKSLAGKYYAVLTRRGTSGVRMPTPDGKGPVVDHLAANAVNHYLNRFSQVFDGLKPKDLPRAYNNDSWEIDLNWTPGLLDEFAKRRGYDLRDHLPAFMGQDTDDRVARVACDYRQTVSDLLVDAFTATFSQWAASQGGRITGEVHGEPGNELDINALYDIPQADMGGPRDWFISKGDYATDHFFRRCKIPASVAHLLGKPLISSETLTCMGPILETPLELVKEKIDYDLVAGVNHTMFHGITYSPSHARWPGWLFYAGTHLGPFNPMWRQGKQLCDYITRCQSFLQAGQPDADVLVYYPVFDLWSTRQAGGDPAPPGTVQMENAGPPAAAQLWRAGHDFDFISDRLLQSVKVADGRLVAPGTSYQALVVSDCRLMPAETMARMVQFISDGATVIFNGKLPVDVPGLGNLDKRRDQFRTAMAKIDMARKNVNFLGVGTLGKGKVIFAGDVIKAMEAGGIRREMMTGLGLRYYRRKDVKGTTYFIVNPAENIRVDEWVPLSGCGKSAVIFDPMTGLSGLSELRMDGANSCMVRLQLEPNESRIVRILDDLTRGPAWTYFVPAGEPVTLTGKWDVKFLEGGETIPHAETITELISWTTWKSDQSTILGAFSGVACYSIKFLSPKVKADAWALDLGEVRHTARVRLNGKVVGEVFSRPMRVMLGSLVNDTVNLLEIEVANAPINRAADLDIRDIPWQMTMGEDASSFVIGDFLFPWQKKDASWVPRPSGLLGPVKLVPLDQNP
jgi:hypothetical protein